MFGLFCFVMCMCVVSCLVCVVCDCWVLVRGALVWLVRLCVFCVAVCDVYLLLYFDCGIAFTVCVGV